jgi:hypothetical protein
MLAKIADVDSGQFELGVGAVKVDGVGRRRGGVVGGVERQSVLPVDAEAGKVARGESNESLAAVRQNEYCPPLQKRPRTS